MTFIVIHPPQFHALGDHSSRQSGKRFIGLPACKPAVSGCSLLPRKAAKPLSYIEIFLMDGLSFAVAIFTFSFYTSR
ncbi:MAG: hypothetical protein DIU68_016240 [Chloroflexota bacterium]